VLKNYVTSVQSHTDDRARPGKNGRGADWLWRWPAGAGWARESPCRSCACWAWERGWLAVTVASTGGLGTGESLQVRRSRTSFKRSKQALDTLKLI
jgi:hypothetical protein